MGSISLKYIENTRFFELMKFMVNGNHIVKRMVL